MTEEKTFTLSCPLPGNERRQVTLAHGGGGKLMHDLLERYILPAFRNPQLDARHDGAVLTIKDTRVAFTTDSYVVRPLFFPGGDIGSLAINGTVNDLAMCGARPAYLSAALIMEEGLPLESLDRIIASMQRCTRAAGVEVVTGDTKVVDKGKGDGIFINTAGVGVIEHGLNIGPANVRPGDAILLSGDLGRHGIAIMATREGLEFESAIESDCASVAAPVLALLDAGIQIHCLRDLTRGGLATALVELAETAAVHLAVEEEPIAVREDVCGACEILGFDPLYLANEGRFVAFLPEAQADQALEIMRQYEVADGAVRIGQVTQSPAGTVVLNTRIGTARVLDMLSGEQLPRIC